MQQSITSTDCLNAAGITDNAAVSKYIDEGRVILTPSSSKIQISPNMGSVANVIYTQTGNSTANTTKFCSNGKALAITVDKLGTVNKEKGYLCMKTLFSQYGVGLIEVLVALFIGYRGTWIYGFTAPCCGCW